jgi:hypothetical protein
MEVKKFYSGFYLQNESELFSSYIDDGEFCFCAFSMGCCRLVDDILSYNKRVDKIQLFSPAFFCDKDNSFKESQLKIFSKNEKVYVNSFLKNCAYPNNILLDKYISKNTKDDLAYLLNYNWYEEKMLKLTQKYTNIDIEIFLGESDKIISSSHALEFFKNFGSVYVLKEVGHILTKKI